MPQFRAGDKWNWWAWRTRQWGDEAESRVSVTRGVGDAEGGSGWEKETDSKSEGKTLANEKETSHFTVLYLFID